MYEYKIIFGILTVISLIFVILILLKNIFHPTVFFEELKHPVTGSFIPTFSMTIATCSVFIAYFATTIGAILWYTSLIIHAVILLLFIYFRIKQNDYKEIAPSWFIPPVGLLVACINYEGFIDPTIPYYIFFFCLIFYIILAPIIAYNIIFNHHVQHNNMPIFAIMGAPTNLIIACYLTVFPASNEFFLSNLITVGLFSIIIVYISLIRLVQLIIYTCFCFIYISFGSSK